LKVNSFYPAVLNIVSKDFSGSNIESLENVRDEVLFLRTNICKALANPKQYPLKETTCTYDQVITVIRPKNPTYPTQFLKYEQIYRIGVITTAPIKVEKKLKGDRMTHEDFVKTHTTIQAVFQFAIANQHRILILQPFGHEEDNNPIEDIIKIYNYCILKYGHCFQKIIVAVPQYYANNIFELYKSKIVIPSVLVQEVDLKYDTMGAEESLLKLASKNEDLEEENMHMHRLLDSMDKR